MLHGWTFFVHSRAKEFYEEDEDLEKVLLEIARNLDAGDDVVCGPADCCMVWRGKLQDGYPVMQVKKPGEGMSQVWVIRVLAHAFASDKSFQELMKLPKRPFSMSCGNQLCLNISHISPAITIAECNPVSVVTLCPMPPHPLGLLSLSCTEVGGSEIARLEVASEETSLANIREAVAARLAVPAKAVQLLTRCGDVLPQASDNELLSSLPL
jgi:hypothetical protein